MTKSEWTEKRERSQMIMNGKPINRQFHNRSNGGRSPKYNWFSIVNGRKKLYIFTINTYEKAHTKEKHDINAERERKREIGGQHVHIHG